LFGWEKETTLQKQRSKSKEEKSSGFVAEGDPQKFSARKREEGERVVFEVRPNQQHWEGGKKTSGLT